MPFECHSVAPAQAGAYPRWFRSVSAWIGSCLRRSDVFLLAFLLLSLPAAAQQKPLEVEVLRTSAGSLHVNVALIKGERDAVLVDTPFTLADAHRTVAMILDSGKRLTHVFITHDHPDHFFAMEVIADAFPDAKIVAHPVVVADIWRSLPFKVKRWGPMLGANGPRQPTAPAAIDGDTILLEGRELKVMGPMAGDHIHATALWAPSIRALFPGDLVFNDMHLWLGEHDAAAIAAWGRSLDTLAVLNPTMVVAGHSRPGLPHDLSGLEFSRRYIGAWPKLVAQSKDSADLSARVQRAFPQAIDVFGDFLLGNSSKVAMGEQERWQE
jgi:glyoxylase-like metal-dependent hydrolase (beta-lactamase superfamily II)